MYISALPVRVIIEYGLRVRPYSCMLYGLTRPFIRLLSFSLRRRNDSLPQGQCCSSLNLPSAAIMSSQMCLFYRFLAQPKSISTPFCDWELHVFLLHDPVTFANSNRTRHCVCILGPMITHINLISSLVVLPHHPSTYAHANALAHAHTCIHFMYWYPYPAYPSHSDLRVTA